MGDPIQKVSSRAYVAFAHVAAVADVLFELVDADVDGKVSGEGKVWQWMRPVGGAQFEGDALQEGGLARPGDAFDQHSLFGEGALEWHSFWLFAILLLVEVFFGEGLGSELDVEFVDGKFEHPLGNA